MYTTVYNKIQMTRIYCTYIYYPEPQKKYLLDLVKLNLHATEIRIDINWCKRCSREK